MSRKLLAANWKLHGSREFITQFFSEWKASAVKTVFCIPAPYFQCALDVMPADAVVGGQDLSEHKDGAYTGEVSAEMLVDMGCGYVIVGHSERRQYHGECNKSVAKKAKMALSAGLVPIVCVGETLSQREQGETEEVIKEQLLPVIELLSGAIADCVIAYEPVWAIGTGETATPEMAQQVHACIRSLLRGCVGNRADGVSILYGGSVNADNAMGLFSMPDIDGGLVGGASLDPAAFHQIGQALAN